MKIHDVFAYLRVRGAVDAIEFYKNAFGATEKFRLVEPGGRVGHAELDFGGVTIMLSDEYPELDIRGPQSIGGTSVGLHLHVDDADETIRRAVAEGATVLRAAENHFYGERSGTVRDPFGHEWNVGHEIEKLDPKEMQRRYAELMAGGGD